MTYQSFVKLKNIRESGMTTIALGQILPTIIMTGDFDESMVNIFEKMQSNVSSR